jgi:general secretion pathway protein C
MIRSPIARRVVGAVYLTLASLIIAHATNAFIADALHVPSAMPNLSSSGAGLIAGDDPADSQQRIEEILRSGLFELPPVMQRGKDGAPAPGPPSPPIEAARKVAFLGSVHGTDSGAMAIVEDLTSKTQALYRVGAEVPNVGTLQSVEKDRVLFKSGPSEEWLRLAALNHPTSDGGITPAPQPSQARATPTRQVLDRREVTAVLNDPTRLMTQAQAVPFLTDGKLDGFRLSNIVPTGFFDKLGLRTNDVVQRINGIELRDPGMLLSLFQQLRNENTVRVDMMRTGQRQTLTYEIR